jgi:hypothetical protein
MGDHPIDPAEVLAAWPDDDAVRESPELAVEQIHELVALIEESSARHAETRILLARRAAECRRAEEQRDQETAWNAKRTEEFTATLAQTVAAAEAEMLLAVVDARKAALLEAADELDRFAAKPTGQAAIDFLRARADAQGSTPKPSPTPAPARDTAVPGVEVGTVVGLDLDGVRNGHVPWPGTEDDGTCSCCGMPYPCVTRRLADELEDARAQVARLLRWKAEATTALNGWEAARAEIARLTRELGHADTGNGKLSIALAETQRRTEQAEAEVARLTAEERNDRAVIASTLARAERAEAQVAILRDSMCLLVLWASCPRTISRAVQQPGRNHIDDQSAVGQETARMLRAFRGARTAFTQLQADRDRLQDDLNRARMAAYERGDADA